MTDFLDTVEGPDWLHDAINSLICGDSVTAPRPFGKSVALVTPLSMYEALRGNHDDYVCRFDTCDIGNWMYNGGTWFVGLPLTEQQNYQVMFDDLPIAIEVETAGGMIGIVHADCVFGTWAELKAELESPETRKRLKLVHNTCMWSRSRVENRDMTPVSDMRAVVVGHTPLRQPMVLGNVHHIDTGGWFPDGSGYFTLLELGTLTTIPATRPELLQDFE